MNLEEISKLDEQKKKELLADLIKNDVTYWEKILILMSGIGENESTELVDFLAENKVEEINLANKIYGLGIISDDQKLFDAGINLSALGDEEI